MHVFVCVCVLRLFVMKHCLIHPVKNKSLIEMTVERRVILMWPLDTDSLVKLAHLYLADWGKIVREEFNNPLYLGPTCIINYQDALNWICFFHELVAVRSWIYLPCKRYVWHCFRIWLKCGILVGSIIKLLTFFNRFHIESVLRAYDEVLPL